MKAGEKSTAAREFYKRVFDIAARATTEEGTSIREEVLGPDKGARNHFGQIARCIGRPLGQRPATRLRDSGSVTTIDLLDPVA
jgi:hypothetical protein